MATEASKRRMSVSTRDSSDHGVPALLSQPAHRRTSRIDAGQMMGHGARRMSIMLRRPSLAGSQRTDLSHSVVAAPRLQNTYRLQPGEGDSFASGRVSKAISSILESFLEGETYDQKRCALMSQNLTEVIKTRVKEMHFPRYKFVCHVILGQQGDQSIQAASRCVWNTDTDNFAQGTYSSKEMFAVANVYGCYFE